MTAPASPGRAAAKLPAVFYFKEVKQLPNLPQHNMGDVSVITYFFVKMTKSQDYSSQLS